MQVSGTVDPRFARLGDLLAGFHADGLMQGGSVSVVIDGNCVAELWCGHADAGKQKLWQRDTLVNVWSCTKGVMALAIAMAVDRGQLRYDAPLADVWPEFGCNGKAEITLDHVMSHRAGLHGFPHPVPRSMFFDWQLTVDALAAMTPISTPGEVCVYHPLTYGHLTGEALRRATDKSPGQFVRDEIASRLPVDFHIGVSTADDPRFAEVIAGPGSNDWVAEVAASPYPQSCRNPTLDPLWPNERRWRKAEIPGGNGHSTALGLATVFGDMARREPQLLSAAAVREAGRVRFKGVDQSSGSPACWGAGFTVGRSDEMPLASQTTLSHGGWGGSFALADPEAHVGFAFVTNAMLGFDDGVDPRRLNLIQAVYEQL